MGKAPCCNKMGIRKGPWSAEEDTKLITYIRKYAHGNWRQLPKQAGLLRCGKSCRLRWTNYLRPDVKRGNLSPQEEQTIIRLRQVVGNRWSTIASFLPGRTDNEIKNVWNTRLKKRISESKSEVQTPKYSISVADCHDTSSIQSYISDEFTTSEGAQESGCHESKCMTDNFVDEVHSAFLQQLNSEMEQLLPNDNDTGCNSSDPSFPAEQIELLGVNSVEADKKRSVADYMDSVKRILDIDIYDQEQTSETNSVSSDLFCSDSSLLENQLQLDLDATEASKQSCSIACSTQEVERSMDCSWDDQFFSTLLGCGDEVCSTQDYGK